MSTEAFLAARDLLLDRREDYDDARQMFQWPTLATFNWALDWFDAHLAMGERGDRLALKIVGQHACDLTFRQLSLASNRVANGLMELGVRRGDRVLLMLGNCAPLWEVMLACMKIGAVTIPASTLLTKEDVVDRVKFGGVKFWITDDELARRFDDLDLGIERIVVGSACPGWTSYDCVLRQSDRFTAQTSTAADDPMLLYFTSGTTARPKLVLHSHRSYPVGSLSTMYWLGLQPGDIHLNVSTPGWAKHAWSCFFAPWNAGATVFVANYGRFDARVLLETMRDHDVTSLCAPPTVWRMIVQEEFGPFKGALAKLCGAGEPLNPEVIDCVERAWGLTIRDGFGQTESTAQIGNPPGMTLKPGSVGRVLPGYDVVLLDADGQEVEEGEICLRLNPPPAGLMLGYQREDGTLEPLSGPIYRTGDVARRDHDDYFTYVGRADDVFKASDYRISPFELESALIEHEAVAEAAVVPAPHPVKLAVPKAYVHLRPGVEPGADVALAVFRHIQKTLAPYKRIRRLEFGELPKTISGKIRRVDLRRQELERFEAGQRSLLEFREEDFPELTAARSRQKPG